jgi:hypothetical protein
MDPYNLTITQAMREGNEKDLQLLEKSIDKLEDDISSHAQGMDKWIMGANAATLALSTGIIFTAKFNIYSDEVGWMLVCWISLAISFIFSLTTYLLVVEKSMIGVLSVKAKYSLKRFLAWNHGLYTDAISQDENIKKFDKYGPRLDKAVIWISRLAYLACVIGIICLVIFLIRSTLEMREAKIPLGDRTVYISPLR